MNKNCNTVYFNAKQNIVFDKTKVKVPIWFKTDADPKYICYCNKVTEQQIIDAVLYQKAENMKDIIKLTGAMKNGQCEINNPLGKCCGSVIQETLKKELSMKKKD